MLTGVLYVVSVNAARLYVVKREGGDDAAPSSSSSKRHQQGACKLHAFFVDGSAEGAVLRREEDHRAHAPFDQV